MALICALAIFPGYFVYHRLVAMGLPPVLRGYSVATAALVLPLLFAAYAGSIRELRGAGGLDLAIFGFVLLLVLVASVHAGLGSDMSVVSAHLGSAPQWLSLFLIVRLLDYKARSTRLALGGAWVVMSMLVLSDLSEGRFIGAAIEVALDSRDTLASYQDFAVLYLPVAMAAYAGSRAGIARTLILVTSLAVLFFNGARSELVAMLVGSTLLSWWLARNRFALGFAMLMWACALVVAIAAVVEWVPDNRVVDLIETGAEGSGAERREMLAHAVSAVQASPLTGAYASYPAGEYAHNLLSAWVDLGAIGFAWLTLMLALPALHMACSLSRHRHNPLFASAFGLLVLSILLLATAKTFTYNLIPIALGAYAAFLAHLNRRAIG